jgi:hypothetical protein
MKLMEGMRLGKIDTVYFLDLTVSVGGVNQKAPCLPCVAGDRAEVLARDCDLHISWFLNSYAKVKRQRQRAAFILAQIVRSQWGPELSCSFQETLCNGSKITSYFC